ISKTQILISQDDEMIYYIPMTQNENGRPCYLKNITKPITSHRQQQYGIFHKGTIVKFYDPHETKPHIDVKKLISRIQKSFAIKILQNPNITITVNDQEIGLPDFMEGHEYRFICRLKAIKKTRRGHVTTI